MALIRFRNNTLSYLSDLWEISQIIVVINERKNINTTLPEDENILQLAIREFRHYHRITELIKVILDLGADVNAKDSLGNSALSNVLLSKLSKFIFLLF